MDLANPLNVLLAIPALLALWWFQRRSLHPMSTRRKRLLMVVRGALVALLLVALAQPAWNIMTHDEAVIFVLDHSQSEGRRGQQRCVDEALRLARSLPRRTYIGVVSAGSRSLVRALPERGTPTLAADAQLTEISGSQTDLESAVQLARGLFPPGVTKRLVILSDGIQTRGDVEEAAREAAIDDVVIDALAIAGQPRPDVRIAQLRTSKSRLHEGATLEITADVESSLAGRGRVRLFENGIEVESRPIRLKRGEQAAISFRRVPEQRNLYTYRAQLDGFAGDQLPDNDQAMALVDVRGRPLLLYVEGDAAQSHYLVEAMEKEGIRLELRQPEEIPDSLQDLAGYDGVVLSDVPAHQVNDRTMALIRDYVEQLGGGFLMVGGMNSFGVGGYYRTPIEDILPVKMKAPDTQVQHSTALALVVDRSGSMSGQKLELCKSACIATVELLSRKDYIAVVAFDDQAHWVVPMTAVTSPQAITSQIASIGDGGGTNLEPGMNEGYQALAGVKAKIKHMIILTDGQTGGAGYEARAAQMKQEGMTVSTVAVGDGADVGLLQRIATEGGGQPYVTTDPTNIPKIFTQDAMVHMGKLVREEAFVPQQVERHAMLEGWPAEGVPPLLGYVKTNRKATAQIPLVTDLGDPLLAHWRFGLGKVTAFTSDCKSRWAAMWISAWPPYSRFWAQVLREMARPPQGRSMDIRVQQQAGGETEIAVDVLEGSGQFKNDAQVSADIYFVPAGALGSSMRLLEHSSLEQTGPGRYDTRFRPTKPGVYLVRARSGADLVSVGLVHNVSGEWAAGRVNEKLLARACQLTGGMLLKPDSPLPQRRAGHARYIELTGPLLRLILLLFVADVSIRRWENVLGMWESIRGLWQKPSP